MRINPDFVEREEGNDLVLFNLKNRTTILLPQKKALGFQAIKQGLSHKLSDEDIDILHRYEVIVENNNFSRSPQKGLDQYLADVPSLYNFYTKKFYPHKAPLGVLWSITQACNLNCPYCHASAKSSGSEPLHLNDLIVIADKIIAAGAFEIVLNGGEPFTRPDIFELLENLRRRNINLSINTNGTLIDNKMAQKLAVLSMIVGVSLDGPNEEINSLTRGKGSFDKTVAGIKKLMAAGVTTHILTTVTRLNYSHISEILRLAQDLGVMVHTLQDLHPAGYAMETYDDLSLTAEQEKSILPLLQELAHKFNNMTINTTELSYFAYHSLLENHNAANKEPLHLFQCTACTETLYIDAAGELYPCVALPNLPMGNLLRDDFDSCWNESLAAQTIRSASKLPVTIIDICNECDHNHICTGGCRGDAIAIYDDWLAAHPRCPKRRTVLSTENGEGTGGKST